MKKKKTTAKKSPRRGAAKRAPKRARRAAKPSRKAGKSSRKTASKKPARARRSTAARRPKTAAKAGTRAGTSRTGRGPSGGASAKPATPIGENYGEGNWKADEEYREGLREFSRTHDAEALARRAKKDLPADLRESENEDVADSARRGAEEEPEW